jgi:hypothetical protein
MNRKLSKKIVCEHGNWVTFHFFLVLATLFPKQCATMSLFGTVDTQLIIHEHKEFVFFESRKGEEAQASSMLRLSAVVQARNINFDFNRSRLSLSLSGGL